MNDLPLTRFLAVRDVPPLGKRVTVTADAQERQAIADFLGLPAVHRLEARLEIRPWMRDGLQVRGELEADVDQVCVVSLETFITEVREEIDDRFSEDVPALHAGDDEAEHETDLDAPDEIVDGRVDLGALALEYLALGLDPYPRKPGVAAPQTDEEAPPEGKHRPFAGLDKLVSSGKPKKKH